MRQHPEVAKKLSEGLDEGRADWQTQVQMDQSIKLVADLQVALQKEIR